MCRTWLGSILVPRMTQATRGTGKAMSAIAGSAGMSEQSRVRCRSMASERNSSVPVQGDMASFHQREDVERLIDAVYEVVCGNGLTIPKAAVTCTSGAG